MLRSAKAVISARAAFHSKMAPPLVNGSLHSETRKPVTYSITALNRWSCQNNPDLPAVPQIKAIHVYDFDNTLFLSPLPNPQLWNGPTIGFLQAYESFANGGWWHDPNLLAATGQGIEIEEPLGWKGWWNEQILQLVVLSIKQKDALTVLLTGRAESRFADIIKRIIRSRNLEFDLTCLKPEVGPNGQRFSSTMNFKQTFLEDLVLTYNQADEIRVYEDRVKHVKGFREYFEKFNRSLLLRPSPPARKPLLAEVIQVAEEGTFLPPATEVAEIQRMINAHNLVLATGNITKSPYGRLQIKRTIFYTGYILSSADSSRLVNYLLTPLLPPGLAESGDVKFMANNILITPRPAPKAILDKVGGIGKRVRWRVTGTALFENKLWAARVAPIVESEPIYTENPEPVIVLGLRKGARPIDVGKIHNWQPVAQENALVFDAVVGQKVVLRVDEQHEEGEWENAFVSRPNKRRQQHDPRDDEAYSHPRENRDSARHHGSHDFPLHGRHNQQHQRHPAEGGNRYHNSYNDDGPRRGGTGNSSVPHGYRGGHGRGGRGGRSGLSGRGGPNRGRGRGTGGGRDGGLALGYRSLDDYGAGPGGYDGGLEDRGPPGGGGPVMNY